MQAIAKEIGELLKERGLWLGVVESATGGLLSSLITDVPGSSDYYQGSVTSYSNEAKMNLLGVKRETLEQYGAVSAQVAEEMALGGCRALNVDICLSDTGIAGPTGATTDKPLGLFYLGLAHKDQSFNRKHVFSGNREQNRTAAALVALNWLKEYLQNIQRKKGAPIVLKVQPVVSCFLENNRRILVVRRSAQVRTYEGLWGAISGYIDSTPDRQALTEIKEEAGLSSRDIKLISRGQPIFVTDKKLKTRWEVHPYLFKVINPDKLKFDWEQQETRWITPDELDSLQTVPRLKEAFESALQAAAK
jgi:PncC family amidohydrolase